MKNDELPGDSGGPWNTDDVAFGQLSCKQLSKLTTSFISALRMANKELTEFGVPGIMNLIATVFQQQIELLNSNELSAQEKAIVDRNGVVALLSACMAGIFSINAIDPRELAGIGVSVIEMVHNLAKKTGPIGPDDEVMIQFRRGESNGEVQMAIHLEPASDIALKIGDDNIGKQIKKIVEGPAPKLNPPDFELGESGPN
jgi:hypothetical protein